MFTMSTTPARTDCKMSLHLHLLFFKAGGAGAKKWRPTGPAGLETLHRCCVNGAENG